MNNPAPVLALVFTAAVGVMVSFIIFATEPEPDCCQIYATGANWNQYGETNSDSVDPVPADCAEKQGAGQQDVGDETPDRSGQPNSAAPAEVVGQVERAEDIPPGMAPAGPEKPVTLKGRNDTTGDPWITFPQMMRRVTNGQADGVHFLLISAEWCRPCQELKARIRANPPNRLIVLCDYEKYKPQAQVFMNTAGRQSIPVLMRVELRGSEILRRDVWNGSQPLNQFFR